MNVAAQDSVAVANPLGGTPPKEAKAAKAAPVPEADEADEAPPPPPKASRKTKPAAEAPAPETEPEVRSAAAKTPAVPAKKSSLADLVADWDDE